MSISHTPAYYYPNKMGRIILFAYQEILGKDGLVRVLTDAQKSRWLENYPPNNLERDFDFENLGEIQATLDQLYGPRGGQGLALRVGRASFKYGLREFGPILGITDLAFRLLPLPQKLAKGAGLFAETFNKYSDQRVRVTNTETEIHWYIDRCPVCWNRQTTHPSCNLAVGILQEALYWISGGKHFNVEETECIAQGSPNCKIVIDKAST